MTLDVSDLRAPFPYHGGKRPAARLVWERFGVVYSYTEPFAGSLAVLLGRPRSVWRFDDHPGAETVNDMSCHVANFWRSVQRDPDAVRAACDYPVSEVDLHARHRALVAWAAAAEARMREDVEHCDPKLAGWWAWGLSQWIGTGWCEGSGRGQMPMLQTNGGGVHGRIPELTTSGKGVHSLAPRGDVFDHLRDRLRRVRVVCGDWERLTTDSATGISNATWGPVGVFLDPPYDGTEHVYGDGTEKLSARVREWCRKNGGRKRYRIAICGHADEHDELLAHGWTREAWTYQGGLAKENRHRERIWFSPHCLLPRQAALFGEAAT